ncbi:MAG: LTA synthase family protein [Bacteroidaceae bacterium]|nr:LTA synthase family protein [Bacteroidaceae bacterium]
MLKQIWNTLTKQIEWQIPKYKPTITTSWLRVAGSSILILTLLIWSNIALANANINNYGTYCFWMNAACITAWLLLVCNYHIPEKIAKWLSRAAIILMPLLTICMAEVTNTHYPDFPLLWWLTYSFYIYLYILGYACTGKFKYAVYILNPIIWILSTANYYVSAFRGTTFVPLDILYADTAATVTKSYNFAPNHELLCSAILLVLTLVLAAKILPRKLPKWKMITKRVITGILTVCLLGSYFVSNTFANQGFHPDFYEQGYSASRFGVTMNFWMNLKYLSVEKPDGYDAETIEDKMMAVIGELKSAATNKQPHVICIMNEALSDLSIHGDFSTNVDYMPFIRSLTENTVRGNLYIPVYGNGTCNSELEFLTGFSTVFAPAGSKPYSMHINSELPSLVHTFENSGYNSVAFHPYYKDNWNRTNVYDYMGFNTYYGMEDVISNESLKLMESYAPLSQIQASLQKTYPGKSYLTRQYLNDEFDYDMIIKWYEESTQPLFLFNVTMQNHGGFEPIGNFDPQVWVTNEDGSPAEGTAFTNQYLSLVYESDKQLQRLIEYFESQDEPVVVVVFGDHQPMTGDNFILDTIGANSYSELSIQQNQNRYVTPFLIWANYDIEERQIDMLSSNYLGSYLMDAIGMEMPAFNQYLLKLSEILPVISTQGYIDKDGKYFIYEQQSPYSQLITDYQHICYNLLYDTDNRCDQLFYP